MAHPPTSPHWPTRASAWAIAVACVLGSSFLACAGDGPTAVPELDLTRSTLTVAAGPYFSGQTYAATLTARTASGEPFTDPIAATLSLVNGTSAGTFSAISSTGAGTYVATMTATTAGTPSQLRATIAGEGDLTAPQPVTVVPGIAASAATLVTVSAASIAVGATTTITVTVRDANHNVRTGGGDTVGITLAPTAPGGGQLADGTLSAVTDHHDGTYTATFTGTRWGVRGLAVTVFGTAVPGTLPTITVQMPPPSAAASTLLVSRPAITAGDTSLVTLELRDPAGNRVTWTGITVAFTKGAGTSDGTFGSVVDRGDGTYSTLFTATTAGTPRAIGATIAGAPVTTTAPTITVSPGVRSLAQSTVTVTDATLAAGAQTTLTLTARDALGNRLATGGLAVAFTKGSGTSDGTIGAVTDHGDGTYTAPFTATTTGTARSIGATIGGAALTSAAPTITVTAGALSLQQTTLTTDAATLASGAPATLTVTARDAQGNAITSGGATVAIVKGAGTSDGTIGTVTDQGDGTYRATFTATTAGTARTLTATVNGNALTSPAVAITVTPGVASAATSTLAVSRSTLLVGDTATLELTTRDAAGNLLATGGAAVAFTKGSGTADGTIGPVTDLGDGRYRARFTATTAGTARTIGATVGGVALATPSVSLAVSSVPPSLALSTVTVGAPSIASGTTTTLTLTVRDSTGAVLATGGRTVLFTLGAGTSTGTLSAVTDQGDGTYTATFTGVAAGTPRAVGASMDGAPVTSAAPTITVTPGAASVTTSTLAVGTGTLASGATTAVTLTTRDAAGNALTSGGLGVAFTLGAGTSSGTFSAVTDAGDGTYTATFTATTAGSARTVGATIGGAPIASALPTITVTAGTVSLTRSRVQVGSGTLPSGDSTTLTLSVRDAAGNLLTGGGLTVAFTKDAGSSDGTIGAVTDAGDGTYTAWFRATAAGTARTIGATIGGEAITPDTVATVTVLAGVISPATSTLTAGKDTVIAGDTTSLVLTARDAAGNLVGAGGATVAFTKGAGTADGTISAVTDVGDGTYRATFTARTIGTPRSFGVTINGTAGSLPGPTVTVRPGRFSLAHSSMVPNRDTLRRLDTLEVVLIARDSLGNALDTGGLTVRWGALQRPLVPATGTCTPFSPPLMLDDGDGTYRLAPGQGQPLYGTGVNSLLVWVQGEPGFDATCTLRATADSVVVRPARGAAAQSSLAASPKLLQVGQVSTLTITVRDRDFFSTLGGDTVTIVADAATANGTVSAVTDHHDGTYTATFTAVSGGGPARIRARVNGDTIRTDDSDSEILVFAPVPDMALATDSVGLLAQQGTTGPAVLVAVANAGTGAVGGLSTTQQHVSGPTGCATTSWLVTPTFDKGGIADPVSVMTLQANATGLPLGVCVRRLIVSSTTPGVQPETLLVSVDVGRTAVATGLVNVVMMGDASSNTVQTIAPTPVLRIDNGGRGTVSNLTATIVSQTGFAECVDPFDEATCVPWLAPSDLVFSAPTLPATLSIVSQVRPFSATARVRVAGTGMAARDFDINVVFNVLPELVTNPRAAIFRANRSTLCCQTPSYVTDTLIALNQNTAHPGLTNYRLDPATPIPEDWSVQVTPFGNSARVIITANVSGLPDDTTTTSSGLWYYGGDANGNGAGMRTGGIRILADCTNANDCFDFGTGTVVPKSFTIPWTVQTARGLTFPFDTLAITARDTTTQVIDVPITTLGPGAVENLNIAAGPDPRGWIEAQIVGGTSTPAVLRLTVRPALSPASPESRVGVLISGSSQFVTGNDGNYQIAALEILLHRRFP